MDVSLYFHVSDVMLSPLELRTMSLEEAALPREILLGGAGPGELALKALVVY